MRTGSRSIALIGRRVSGSLCTATIGPLRSIGSPCESTTRPSRPSPTGRCSVRSTLRRHGWRASPSFIATAGDGARHDARAARQALDVAGRHQVGAVAGEADDLGEHRRLAGHAHFADRADRHADAGRLEHQAGDADQQALRFERHRIGGERFHVGEIALPVRRRRSCGRLDGSVVALMRGVAGSAPRCGVSAGASPRLSPPSDAAARRQRVSRLASMTPMSDSTSSRRARSRVGDQARAARREQVAGAVGDQRLVVGMDAQGDVAGAQHQRLERLLGDRGDQLRAGTPARCARSGARARSRCGERLRPSACCIASSWSPSDFSSGRPATSSGGRSSA